MTRTRASVLSIALLAAVLSPLVVRVPSSAYPITHYGIYAWTPEAVKQVPVAIGFDRAGDRRVVGPEAIVGVPDGIQAGRRVRQAIADGPEATLELCRDVAARVRGGSIVRVEVLIETVDVVAALDDEDPESVEVFAACAVP